MMLGVHYAEQEREAGLPLYHERTEEERAHQAELDKAAKRRTVDSVSSISNDYVKTYMRPTNWTDPEHSAALYAIWTKIADAEISNPEEEAKKAAASSSSFSSSSNVPAAQSEERRRSVERRRKLDLVEQQMGEEFPALREGEVSLERAWMEFVLGREGVLPFSWVYERPGQGRDRDSMGALDVARAEEGEAR